MGLWSRVTLKGGEAMRQAVMAEPGRIVFQDAAKPVPGPDEVLVRIQRIGVCGSDVHVYHGRHPFTRYPVVQGHEYCGTVEAVGERVEGVVPGTLATGRPQLVCGTCGPCRRGDYHICAVLRVQGFQAPGCAQDFFVIPRDRFIPLPETFSLEQGALVEPVSVGCHSTGRAGGVQGKNVVVFGAGTIGNLVAQVARARGARKVLVVDLSGFRLEKARECGIEWVSNAATEPLSEAAGRAFGKEGFQLAFEAAGSPAALDAAIAHIEKGGTIVILGVFEKRPEVDISVVGEHELRVVGTLMYKHEDYLEAVAFVKSGQIATAPLVTRHFPFDQYLDAYRFIESQGDKTLKVMIDL
jgi:2-desacetyl-2-hydroxyethyl bacteriochlorophyllide A dehydrogenase